MAKQSVDARFIGGRDGYYTSVASGTKPVTGSAEIGILVMPTPFFETRAGATGIVGSPGESLYGGGNLGVRLHSPSRFAPFIGVGGYAGMEPWELLHDGDDLLTSTTHEHDGSEFVLAVYPELGAHFWLTPQWRLTTSTSYYIGWGEEPWFFSIGLAKIPGPKAPPRIETWIGDWLAEGSTEDSATSVHGSSTQRLTPVD